MSATFRQPEISVREELNALDNLPAQVAQNTWDIGNQAGMLGGYTGKNLLINGNKGVSQRGDFLTPVTCLNNTYYIDRYTTAITGAGLAVNISLNNGKLKQECTTGASSAFMGSVQSIENPARFDGRVLTYSALVTANHPVVLRVRDGARQHFSPHHSGDGSEVLMTVTFTKSVNDTLFQCIITEYDGSLKAVNVGDFFEVGNEQLELGDQATDFEVVDPATQLMRCQRYYELIDCNNQNIISSYTLVGAPANFDHTFRMIPKRVNGSVTTDPLTITGSNVTGDWQGTAGLDTVKIRGTFSASNSSYNLPKIKIDSELY